VDPATNCTASSCNGKLPSDPEVCGGNGLCIALDVCACFENYDFATGCQTCNPAWEDYNNNCTSPLCFGKRDSDNGSGTSVYLVLWKNELACFKQFRSSPLYATQNDFDEFEKVGHIIFLFF